MGFRRRPEKVSRQNCRRVNRYVSMSKITFFIQKLDPCVSERIILLSLDPVFRRGSSCSHQPLQNPFERLRDRWEGKFTNTMIEARKNFSLDNNREFKTYPWVCFDVFFRHMPDRRPQGKFTNTTIKARKKFSRDNNRELQTYPRVCLDVFFRRMAGRRQPIVISVVT